MARRPRRSIDPDELDESPSEEDLERFGDVTQKCPECGTELYDDVEVCWKCGHALASGPTARTPAALIVVLIIVMVIVLMLIFGKIW